MLAVSCAPAWVYSGEKIHSSFFKIKKSLVDKSLDSVTQTLDSSQLWNLP